MFESVLRLVKSCVFRPLDRRQASGHTLRCVRYEPTVIYNLVQPPGIEPVHTIPNNYTMAGNKRTVDIRLAFEQFDMMPGPAGKKFQRNLLLNGGSADTQGFSITDCFLRLDDLMLCRMGSRPRCRHQQASWLHLVQASLPCRVVTLAR